MLRRIIALLAALMLLAAADKPLSRSERKERTAQLGETYRQFPVSYTHLTLPTICSV